MSELFAIPHMNNETRLRGMLASGVLDTGIESVSLPFPFVGPGYSK